MADRILIDGNATRIIISKPGFNATPSLADANKIFDSDWFFSGQVIHCGTWSTTFPSAAGTYNIWFPNPVNFQPSAMVYQWGGPSNPQRIAEVMRAATYAGTNSNNQEAIFLPIVCHSNRLEIPYPARNTGPGNPLQYVENVMRFRRENGFYVILGV